MAQRITGHTELIGLVATPIRHSKSPMMHNTAFEALGLDYAYLVFEVGIEMAEKVGCHIVNGLGMMIYQGAAAFKLWTGKDMPIDAVKAALAEN